MSQQPQWDLIRSVHMSASLQTRKKHVQELPIKTHIKPTAIVVNESDKGKARGLTESAVVVGIKLTLCEPEVEYEDLNVLVFIIIF